MKKRIFADGIAAWLCAASLVISPAGHAENGARAVDITVGSQQSLALGHSLQRIAIGDPSVADVLIIKGDKRGGVLLIGKSPGTTNVMLWERNHDTPMTYTVNVSTTASGALLGAGSPNVKTSGDTAVISGSAASMEQHQRAVAVAEAEARARAASLGSGLNGGADSGAEGKGGSFSRSGGSASGISGGSGSNVVDASTVATRSVVQVDVRVVEFSRSVLKQIGLNILKQNNGFTFGSFAPAALTSATFGASPSFNSTTPISSAFNLVFNSVTHGIGADLSLMESNNLARVLAEPTLVALSGQSASFLAGGEIPVPVPQGLGTVSIEYKPYGVGLTLTPTVLSPDRIALKVAPEASELDFTNAITIDSVSVPAITTRRADTTVELGDGESFVIGGLIDRQTVSNVSKVPLLGDLPIIGAFFKNMSYSQNDEELVIIVTPHLVSPIAKGAALPSTPGELSEQRDGPVWRALLGGVASPDAAPGFSK